MSDRRPAVLVAMALELAHAQSRLAQLRLAKQALPRQAVSQLQSSFGGGAGRLRDLGAATLPWSL